MALMTVQDILRIGIIHTFAAVASSDTIKVTKNEERHFLIVKNGSGGSINVTITAVKTTVNVKGVGDLTIANEVIAVGAGVDKMIGPFTEAFIDSDGLVTVGYSATATITAGAFKLPAA